MRIRIAPAMGDQGPSMEEQTDNTRGESWAGPGSQLILGVVGGGEKQKLTQWPAITSGPSD